MPRHEDPKLASAVKTNIKAPCTVEPGSLPSRQKLFATLTVKELKEFLGEIRRSFVGTLKKRSFPFSGYQDSKPPQSRIEMDRMNSHSKDTELQNTPEKEPKGLLGVFWRSVVESFVKTLKKRSFPFR
jgi:hypothetical protein